MSFQDKTSVFFDDEVSDRERSCFELGISLGAVFHQFVGTPVGSNSVEEVKQAIQSSIEEQPSVKKVEVEIKRESEEGYSALRPEDLEIKIIASYGDSTVTGKLAYLEKIDYPLMWIVNID
ncbi:dihydroneopterin aldolase family protein [Methanonatronarchaeum sp. AMET-Sl]|uniref:dihydroneopterin aldolase family protein n=1 Tax=Methanonatronarchaeum sp. AMET-Sl TaxID=3037654 RepID=UPI00244E3F19|nr:dihydroneopterin aldolase family protein [Methanonatronarchaeum sp. AMET-Sl]WGI17362.1 dihydroneopterin aldolase family protein [Methanonatronarchaeum sp. AMET-Sl]